MPVACREAPIQALSLLSWRCQACRSLECRKHSSRWAYMSPFKHESPPLAAVHPLYSRVCSSVQLQKDACTLWQPHTAPDVITREVTACCVGQCQQEVAGHLMYEQHSMLPARAGAGPCDASIHVCTRHLVPSQHPMSPLTAGLQ